MKKKLTAKDFEMIYMTRNETILLRELFQQAMEQAIQFIKCDYCQEEVRPMCPCCANWIRKDARHE